MQAGLEDRSNYLHSSIRYRKQLIIINHTVNPSRAEIPFSAATCEGKERIAIFPLSINL